MIKGQVFKWPGGLKSGITTKGAPMRFDSGYDKPRKGANYIVFGTRSLKGVEYIIFDVKGYTGTNPWCVKTSELEAALETTASPTIKGELKIGDIITIPGKELLGRVKSWGNIKDCDISMYISGKQKIFGFVEYKEKEYVQVENQYYSGDNPWMVQREALEKLLNIQTKTTNMAIKNPKSVLRSSLKNGTKLTSTQCKNMAIHIDSGKCMYIVHTSTSAHGSKPSPMPKGYTYSWSLGVGTTNVDLTCNGVFTSIALAGGETKFKNSFCVKGSRAIVKAFQEEAVEAGWKMQMANTGQLGLVFNGSLKEVSGIKGQQCYPSTATYGTKTFNLPGDYTAALAFAKETEAIPIEAPIPEYVECLKDSAGSNPAFHKGRIYKVNVKDTKDCDGEEICVDESDDGDYDSWNKVNFKPSTEDAFDEQSPVLYNIMGNPIVIIKQAINKGGKNYGTIPLACIGCVDSQQVYSLGALETLRDTLETHCKGKGTHEGEGVDFTQEQVETLIDMLENA